MQESTDIQNEKIKEPCNTIKCDNIAEYIVFWPGNTRNMCMECAVRAIRVANYMDFILDVRPMYLPTLDELKQKLGDMGK